MAEEQFFDEKPQANILQQIVQRYLPFWPVFILFTIASLVVAHIYLRSETRMYVVNAKVLIKDPQKSSSELQVLEGLAKFGEKKSIDNEIVTLRSGNLMRKVVDKLHLYNTVYNEGNVQTEELYKRNTPLWFIAKDLDIVKAAGKFSFEVDWPRNQVEINNQKVSLDSGIVKIADQAYIVVGNKNYNRNAKGKNFFVVFNSASGASAALISRLKIVTNSYGSSVLNLTLQTPVPDKGVDVLNTLFEIYNNEGINEKNQTGDKTMNFIDERLAVVEGQLDSVNNNIMNYKARESVTDLSAQASLYFNTVKTLDQKNTELGLQLDVLQSIQNYVNRKGADRGTVPSLNMVTDPILGNLLNQLYTAEFDLEGAKAIAGNKSETVELASDKVNKIKKDIRENLNNIRSSYVTEQNSNNAEIAKNNSLLLGVPAKERGLLDISRQQAIKNNIYTFLLQKKEETALAAAATVADLKVLENAYAGGPISPIPKNYYMAGFFIGLLIFLLYVQIQEQFNNKVLFRSEIEKKTRVPVIAEIVQSPNKDNIAISEGKRTVIAEQIRSLRTNLAFMGFNETHKTLLVTSSVSGEGKSFVAINLAISITLTGKKVALMEMDLRKPRLSKQLKVSRNPGISSYLVGKAGIDEIIKPTSFDNLFVVSAGPIPPNPTELIQLPEFGVMMDELKKKFDYIIIDTAPIGPVTDAQLLAPYINTTLYVVRHAVTPSTFMNLIDNLNKEKKFPAMCVVFNGIKPRGVNLFGYGFGGYGNGYGYGYGYGYSYGYGYGEDTYGYYTSDGGFPGFKSIWGFWKKIKNIFRRRY